VTTGIDLFLSLPWLFLLLAVRALLPLNTAPLTSVIITFLLLGCLGWATPARIIRAGTRTLVNSDYLLQARASGIAPARLFWRHLAPNLRPILLAQFLVSVPVFILSEANLGLLGLGVSEPLPSWGAMLRELENYTAVLRNPWMLAPAILLIAVVGSLQMALRTEDRNPC
jgi:ABC-type dipeptide/oligopeptide/nickel transport system permease subunit